MKNSLLKVLAVVTIVPALIQIVIKQRKKAQLRQRVLADGTSDYEGAAKNIANSIAKSKALYKELITKIHPDRFLDDRKNMATDISARITKSKRNYDELIKLKAEVESFLNNPGRINQI